MEAVHFQNIEPYSTALIQVKVRSKPYYRKGPSICMITPLDYCKHSSEETTELDQEESIVFMPFSKEIKSPEIVPSQLGGTNKQELEQLEDRTMVQIQPQDGYEEQLPHDTIEAMDSSKEVVLHEDPLAPVQHTSQDTRDEVPDITQLSASKVKKPNKKYYLRPDLMLKLITHGINIRIMAVYWKIKTPQPRLWLKTHLMKLTTSKMMHL